MNAFKTPAPAMQSQVRETITTQVASTNVNTESQTGREVSTTQTVEYSVYFILGIIEILLGFRLILKLVGASTASAFVNFVYSLSGMFILPFEGIFRRTFAEGVETTSVLEPAKIVAFVVYAVLAWGIVQLIRIMSGERQA